MQTQYDWEDCKDIFQKKDSWNRQKYLDMMIRSITEWTVK